MRFQTAACDLHGAALHWCVLCPSLYPIHLCCSVPLKPFPPHTYCEVLLLLLLHMLFRSAADGFHIDYCRIPVTDEKAPKVRERRRVGREGG